MLVPSLEIWLSLHIHDNEIERDGGKWILTPRGCVNGAWGDWVIDVDGIQWLQMTDKVL